MQRSARRRGGVVAAAVAAASAAIAALLVAAPGTSAAPRSWAASDAWATYLDAVLVLAPESGSSERLSRLDVVKLEANLRAAVADTVDRSGATDAENDVVLAKLYEHRSSGRASACAPLDGAGGSCVEVDVHVRATDEAHAAALGESLERGVDDVRKTLGALRPMRVGLRSAHAWHAPKIEPATVSAQLRLAAPRGSNALLAGDGTGPGHAGEVGLATALARALNLERAVTVDKWETYLEVALLVTPSPRVTPSGDETLTQSALRRSTRAVVSAFASTINEIPGSHTHVHTQDIHAVPVLLGSQAERCDAVGLPTVELGCGLVEMRVFATDVYEASILQLLLADGFTANVLAEQFAAAGLAFNAIVEDSHVVSAPGAHPVLPSDIKFVQAEELPGCTLEADWRRGDAAGNYDCVDLDLFILAPSSASAEAHASDLVEVVSGEGCTQEEAESRQWKCVAVQMQSVANLGVQPLLLGEPATFVRPEVEDEDEAEKEEESGSSDDTTTVIASAVGGAAGAALLVVAAVWLHFRRKRKQGFKWVHFDNALTEGEPQGEDGMPQDATAVELSEV